MLFVVSIYSLFYKMGSPSQKGHLLGIEIEGDSKVVENIRGEAGIEQIDHWVGVYISNEHKKIGVLACRLSSDGASLQHKLVGAERSILEEDELVLVRGVEKTSWIFSNGEMEGLDSEGGIVSAVVGVDLELGAAKSSLDVCCGGSEYRLVGECYFERDSVACCIELWGIRFEENVWEIGYEVHLRVRQGVLEA